ncbi:MAG: trypsin-like peptidase domain-containing protein [Sphaerochaetaceae bacterium]|nr:trypsin-like peptidase domain-containing protein [Sphaerochaetaceae bacterium]MDC7247294.1 trypsin-like peptidase domain-containing protein [Sphaerochaetaceae bacterium]
MSNSNQFRKRPAVSVFKIIIFIVTITVFVIGILGWTHSLKEKETLSKERQTLQKVLEREGYEGLLEMAGAKVHQIFYGDEGVSVFLGDLDAYTYSADEMRNIAIYERANRSVVNITTVTLDLNSFLEVLPIKGTGSGIIISESGYILTNAHVVQDAATMTVTLHDGTVSEAALIGLDNENDLAVLKIEVEETVHLTPIQFGDGSTLKVGQKVVAIGNPFGYDRTMTLGTVSGLGRPVKVDTNTVINGMIQTDAAINPGNSGGPLLDSSGRMVGICTSIYSTTGGSQGIGFAIPVNTAISVIPDLIQYGKVIRGWLDITVVQLDSSIVSYAELPVNEGLLISEVRPNGKSEKGGLKGGYERVQYGSSIIYLGGDIITKINGIEISDYSDLYHALVDTNPGDIVSVTVVRDSKEKTLEIELVERPSQMEWMVN